MLYAVYIMQYSVYTLQKMYIYIYKENSDSFTLYDYLINWGTNGEQGELFMIIRGINNSS